MSEPAPIVIDLKFPRESVRRALDGAFPGRRVIDLADPGADQADLSGAHYALVWRPDPALFERAGALKAIFSGGAGVDHILSAYRLPAIPVVRFVDRSLTDRMSEWVVMQCLMHLRRMPDYIRQQQQRLWNEFDPQPEARDVTVGVMGLGVLGQDAALKLKTMGFEVIGWSRRRRALAGIETFDGSALDAFLRRTDILVGLLPLTDETRGLYRRDFFARLRQGGALGRPVFINAGRGGSQVEADLAAALEAGVLGGVSLDVFEQEPLAQQSPLWSLPNVILTPHAAAASDVGALVRYVDAQIARLERGEPLENVVDRDAGY